MTPITLRCRRCFALYLDNAERFATVDEHVAKTKQRLGSRQVKPQGFPFQGKGGALDHQLHW